MTRPWTEEDLKVETVRLLEDSGFKALMEAYYGTLPDDAFKEAVADAIMMRLTFAALTRDPDAPPEEPLAWLKEQMAQ